MCIYILCRVEEYGKALVFVITQTETNSSCEYRTCTHNYLSECKCVFVCAYACVQVLLKRFTLENVLWLYPVSNICYAVFYFRISLTCFSHRETISTAWMFTWLSGIKKQNTLCTLFYLIKRVSSAGIETSGFSYIHFQLVFGLFN